MKNCLLLCLSFLFLFSSCKDKVEPDITNDIVGTYKNQENSPNGDQEIVVQLNKKTNSTIQLSYNQTITFKGEYAENEPIEYHFILDDIRLTDSKNFSFDKKTTVTNSYTSGTANLKGTGVISGNALDLAVEITEEATGYSIANQLVLDKQ